MGEEASREDTMAATRAPAGEAGRRSGDGGRAGLPGCAPKPGPLQIPGTPSAAAMQSTNLMTRSGHYLTTSCDVQMAVFVFPW